MHSFGSSDMTALIVFINKKNVSHVNMKDGFSLSTRMDLCG